MGVCKKIKRRADQERNVWELFRMYKNEKKILGLSESTLQNYEDSLKRFMDYMECTDAPIQEIDYDDVLSFTQGLKEGIKENLEDIFGKDGLGQSDFFKGKTDEELENFWDYLQDNNYNPKQMKWDEETTKKNFEAAQEAKKKTPEESVTFASKFKNAAEDTATDIDTVTDNFQSDMKNIQSAMESVTNGTFQNSDMADLIQQFPELSNAGAGLIVLLLF